MFVSHQITIRLWVAGCLALGIQSQAAAQEAPRKSADTIVQAVKVQTTKKNHDPWDVGGGAPDLKVFVRKTGKGGQTHTTKVKSDAFEAPFGERTIRVSVGDRIEVIVFDQDLKGDDVVGKTTETITEAILRKREVNWSFDQVISLTLEFEP